MGESYSYNSGNDATRSDGRDAGMCGTAEWMTLAAAPTFAALAVFTSIHESGSSDILCSAAPHMSPLGDMAVMYVLMSVFHSAPWLKLISSRIKQRPDYLITSRSRISSHRKS